MDEAEYGGLRFDMEAYLGGSITPLKDRYWEGCGGTAWRMACASRCAAGTIATAWGKSIDAFPRIPYDSYVETE